MVCEEAHGSWLMAQDDAEGDDASLVKVRSINGAPPIRVVPLLPRPKGGDISSSLVPLRSPLEVSLRAEGLSKEHSPMAKALVLGVEG